MKLAMTSMNSTFLKRKSKAAKAKPASELTTSPSATVQMETKAVLNTALGKSLAHSAR